MNRFAHIMGQPLAGSKAVLYPFVQRRPRVEVGFDFNPIHIIGDIGGAVISTAGDVLGGIGDAASYAANSAADVANGTIHLVTHPMDIIGVGLTLIVHPGELVKPYVYAMLLTSGAIGLAYAYALDRAGVIEATASAVDRIGGIARAVIETPLFANACDWICRHLAVPEAGIGCLVMSIAVELAGALATGDQVKLMDALRRTVVLAAQLMLDMTDVVKTVLSSAVQSLGKDVDKLFANLDGLEGGLNKVFNDPKITEGIMNGLKEGEGVIKDRIAALPEQAKGSLKQVIAAGASEILNGPAAVQAGMSTGIVTPGPGLPALPFSPASVRPYALAINKEVAELRTATPATSLKIMGAVTTNVSRALKLLGNDDQARDFVNRLSHDAVMVIAHILPISLEAGTPLGAYREFTSEIKMASGADPVSVLIRAVHRYLLQFFS